MIVYTATDINASACPIFCDLIQQKRLAFIAAEAEGKYMVFIFWPKTFLYKSWCINYASKCGT
jgi:hypothetical protein